MFTLLAHKLLPLLVMPLFWALLLLVLATLNFSKAPQRSRFYLFVGLAVLIAFSLPATSKALLGSLENQYASKDIETVGSVDAIVILGGGVSPPNKPRTTAELSVASDRLLLAFRLWKAGKSNIIILSGDTLDEDIEILSEAAYTADILRLWGVPVESIVLEENSVNTTENALFLESIFVEKNLKHVYLVTSAMHMPRAMMNFENSSVNISPMPANRWITNEGSSLSEHWVPNAVSLYGSTTALREYLGILFLTTKRWVSKILK